MQENYILTYPISQAPIIWPALFYDDASGTFDYVASGTGADWTAEYSTDTVLLGTKSLKLQTRLTDPASGDIVSLYKHLPVPPRKLARIQLAFCLGTAATNGNLWARAFYHDGAKAHKFEIRCIYADESVQYLDHNNDYLTIPNAFWSKATNVWNSFDLSIHLNPPKYHLLRLNGLTFDLSALLPYSYSETSTPKFMPGITIRATAAAWTLFYFDQILVTPETP